MLHETMMKPPATTADEEEDEYKWDKSRIRRNLFICAFAFMMNYSAYTGLVYLQSSMNIEDNLGVTGLLVVYITSSVSTITILPSLIDICGAKVAIVSGEIGITVYTLANFYPSWYTIIPAAVVHGITESASWAGTSVYISFLGEKYWELNKERRSKEEAIYKLFSIFHSIIYFTQIFGNGLVSAVFIGRSAINSRNDNIISDDNSSSNLTLYYNSTSPSRSLHQNHEDDWTNCGAKQCQSEMNTTDITSSKYIPDETSVFLLLSIFLVMQITFTCVHAFGLSKIPVGIVVNQEDQDIELKHRLTTSPGVAAVGTRSGYLSYVLDEIMNTLKHLISKLHLCVIPIYFLYGLTTAFTVTEFTKAYISCTMGVRQLGYVMMVFGVSDILTCVIFIKILPFLGRTILYYFTLTLHMGSLLFCLYVQPTPDTQWLVYVGAIVIGAVDAAYQCILNGLIAIYFDKSQAIAYSIKNLIVNLGIVAGAASLFDCVYSEIYLQMGALVTAAISYAVAELLHRRMKTCVKEIIPL